MPDPWSGILEGTTPPYADVQIHVQYGDQAGEIIVLDIDDLDDATAGSALFDVPVADQSALDGIANGDTFILAVTREAPAAPTVAYDQGLSVAVGGLATKPIKDTLRLDISLADGSTLGFTVRGTLAGLAHVQRGAAVAISDRASSTALFSGYVLRADIKQTWQAVGATS